MLVSLTDITKDYWVGERQLHVLRGVSFGIEQGELVAIMGPSGSGKSTLMHILGCLDVPTAGEYQLDGENISSMGAKDLVKIRRLKIGFIFQSFNLLPRLTAWQNVALPLVYSGASNREHRAREMLKKVGLGDRAHHRQNALSGGEMQRVAIARALINDPKIILADEPTGNLDSVTGAEIMQLFHTLHEQGRTIIMVTHDGHLAQQANRIIGMHDGSIIHA